MNKRIEQKKATRKKIIQEAKECYGKNGFSVPTSDIAKRANISHGTIFAHFATSELLIVETVQSFYDDVSKELRSISKKNNLESFLKKHLEVVEKHEKFYTMMINERSKLPKEAQLLFIELQSTISYNFSIVIESTRSELKNLPLHHFFNTWISIIHYYLENSTIFTSSESVLKQHKNELVSMYIQLIAK